MTNIHQITLDGLSAKKQTDETSLRKKKELSIIYYKQSYPPRHVCACWWKLSEPIEATSTNLKKLNTDYKIEIQVIMKCSPSINLPLLEGKF